MMLLQREGERERSEFTSFTYFDERTSLTWTQIDSPGACFTPGHVTLDSNRRMRERERERFGGAMEWKKMRMKERIKVKDIRNLKDGAKTSSPPVVRMRMKFLTI